jgi:hypothetical protein
MAAPVGEIWAVLTCTLALSAVSLMMTTIMTRSTSRQPSHHSQERLAQLKHLRRRYQSVLLALLSSQ